MPSFDKSTRINIYSKKNKFLILGSAHNLKEIKIKENQNVDALFLSSLFNKKKTFLGLQKFKILKSKTKFKVIALGGINEKNINKLKLLNIYGYAAISFFNNIKKKAPKKGPFKFLV